MLLFANRPNARLGYTRKGTIDNSNIGIHCEKLRLKDGKKACVTSMTTATLLFQEK